MNGSKNKTYKNLICQNLFMALKLNLKRGTMLRRLFSKIHKNLVLLGKPLTMHVEVIYLEKYWKKVKRLVNEEPKKINVFFAMTPANYEYFCSLVSPYRIQSKQEVSRLMKERYNWLLKKGYRVELHVHTSNFIDLSYEEERKLIDESIDWFKENLGYRPKLFVPGWFKYTKTLKKILKERGIRPVKYSEYDFLHDYEL